MLCGLPILSAKSYKTVDTWNLETFMALSHNEINQGVEIGLMQYVLQYVYDYFWPPITVTPRWEKF